jgi:small conductance mechanosensitive channel
MDWQDVIDWLSTQGITILLIVLVAYLVFRIARAGIPKLVLNIMSARGQGKKAESWLEKRCLTLSTVFTSATGIIILTIAVFMILSEVGIDIAPLLAGAGVAGIAIGFGAQSVIKDILNGLFILIEDQFNTGDVVAIGGLSGVVEDLNLRRTVMRDLEGIVHIVPNGQITTVSNYTMDWARVKLDISVGYGEDLDHVFKVINRVGTELANDGYYKKLIKSPPQVLRVQNLGDSGIDIRILGDTKPMTQWEVTGELRRRLKKAFDEEGIEIPWPHTKIYFNEKQLEKLIAWAGKHSEDKPAESTLPQEPSSQT